MIETRLLKNVAIFFQTLSSVLVLLTSVGQKGRDIYETFTFGSAGDEMKLESL